MDDAERVREEILREFLVLQDGLEEGAKDLHEKLECELNKRFPGSYLVVQHRVKGLESLAAKIVDREGWKPEERVHRLEDLRDVVGLRLIAPTVGELSQLHAFIVGFYRDEGLREEETRPARRGLAEGEFGYDSVHYVIEHSFRGRVLPVEIQVHTALGNTWSNVSHDTMYKSDYRPTALKTQMGVAYAPKGAKHEMGRLKAALELVDDHYDRFMDRLDRLDDYLGPFLTRDEADRDLLALDAVLAQRGLKAEAAAPPQRRRARLLRRIGSLESAQEAQRSLRDWLPSPEGRLEAAELSLAMQYAEHPSGEGIGPEESQRIAREARESAKGWLDDAGAGDEESADWSELRLCASRRERRGYIQARALETEALLAGWDRDEPGRGASAALLQAARQASAAAPHDPMVMAQLMVASLVVEAKPERLATDIRASLDAGIARCRDLADQGLEIPRAVFAHGRLALLREPLNRPNDEAFRTYCHGVAHCLHPGAAVDARSELGRERTALQRIEDALSGESSRKAGSPPESYAERVHTCRMLFDLALKALDLREGAKAAERRIAVVVAGTTAKDAPEWEPQGKLWTAMLKTAFDGFGGTIIGGGTRAGVCGCVLDAMPEGAPRPLGYTGGDVEDGWAIPSRSRRGYPETDVGEALRYWNDLLTDRVPILPENVTLLGFGGGRISACEYRLAAALGARVALFEAAGRAGAALLADPAWRFFRNIFALLPGGDAVWYALRRPEKLSEEPETRIAIALHNAYSSERDALKIQHDVPEHWKDLSASLQDSNRAQARALKPMLERGGFEVVKKEDAADPVGAEGLPVEALARLEHARWAVDKALDGYRFGAVRDAVKRTHPDLLPWEESDWPAPPPGREREPEGLSEDAKAKDRFFVRSWPKILEEVGLAIRRKEG